MTRPSSHFRSALKLRSTTEKRAALAVIPARAGSKRLPGKNVKLLGGRPAIEYTIEAALRSEVFDRVVVSTDDEGIASIARAAGAEVPFLRDLSLADDYTPVSEVTLDVLDRIDPSGNVVESVCQLMANCPLRNSVDIQDAYSQFKTSGSSSQISLTTFGWLNPWWAVELDESFKVSHLHSEKWKQRSQDLPDVYCPTGAVWFARAALLRKAKTFHTDDKTGFVIPWPRGLDIDSIEDWKLAELLLAAPLH